MYLSYFAEEDIENIELTEIEEKKGTSDKMQLLSKHTSYGSASHIDMTAMTNPSDNVVCSTGRTLAFQRYSALFMIHLKNHLRNKFAHIFQVVIPVALVITGLVLSKTLQQNYENELERQDSLTLNPAFYTKLNPSIGAPQQFPYGTTPRLLFRDTVSKC